jgi:hypothetical protein
LTDCEGGEEPEVRLGAVNVFIASTICQSVNPSICQSVMRLWFLQLSGWPVFLTIVGVVLVIMLALSVGMTRISNRSVVQNYVLAFFAVAVIAAIGLAVAAVVTRW